MTNINLKIPLGILNVPKKKNVIQLRWPLIIGCSFLLLFPRDAWLAPANISVLILLYISTNVALYYLPERVFEEPYVFSPIVILDTLFISFSLVVSGQVESDFFFILHFFLLLRFFMAM